MGEARGTFRALAPPICIHAIGAACQYGGGVRHQDVPLGVELRSRSQRELSGRILRGSAAMGCDTSPKIHLSQSAMW